MSENRVTKEAVWARVNQDPAFAAQSEAVKNAVRPYFEALPEILADMLDQPVTFSRLFQARVRFIHYCFEHDFVRVAMAAMPESTFQTLNRTYYSNVIEGTLLSALKTAEEISRNAGIFLQKHCTTRSKAMRSPFVGMNETAQRLFLDKKLTIGQLLLVQPSVITESKNRK